MFDLRNTQIRPVQPFVQFIQLTDDFPEHLRQGRIHLAVHTVHSYQAGYSRLCENRAGGTNRNGGSGMRLAKFLTKRKKHVPKTYRGYQGRAGEEDAGIFLNSVLLDDGYTEKSAELKILITGEISEIERTITEGKCHHVKRMFEAVGKKWEI